MLLSFVYLTSSMHFSDVFPSSEALLSIILLIKLLCEQLAATVSKMLL